MDELFRSRSLPVAPHRLSLGLQVHVNLGAIWIEAEVTSITHTRIGVAYRRDPDLRLSNRVAPSHVRPAEGVCLRPVQDLCHGEDLVAFDGTLLTIDTTWPVGHRWGISYLNGARTSVPARAVLRLREQTPQVTINGIPL